MAKSDFKWPVRVQAASYLRHVRVAEGMVSLSLKAEFPLAAVRDFMEGDVVTLVIAGVEPAEVKRSRR